MAVNELESSRFNYPAANKRSGDGGAFDNYERDVSPGVRSPSCAFTLEWGAVIYDIIADVALTAL